MATKGMINSKANGIKNNNLDVRTVTGWPFANHIVSSATLQATCTPTVAPHTI